MALNTTLLALGYAIVLMILTSVLRQREEALVDRVDELARLVIAKIKGSMIPAPQPEHGPNQVVQLLQNALKQWREEFSEGLDKIAQHLVSANGGGAGQIEKAFKAGAREMGAILSRKLDEIKDGLHSPPRYQVIVQPLQEAPEHDRK